MNEHNRIAEGEREIRRARPDDFEPLPWRAL